MNTMTCIQPPTYPARPVNGGPLPRALPKPGDWFYEPKYNGWRALVHMASSTMFNRQGELLTIQNEFNGALETMRGALDCQAFKWADCEALERRHSIGRGTLIVLDVIPEPAWKNAPYTERRRWIERFLPTAFPSSKPETESVYKSARIASIYAPQAWEQLQDINRKWGVEFYEGLVAKRCDSPYPIQVRSAKEECTSWMKHRWQY